MTNGKTIPDSQVNDLPVLMNMNKETRYQGLATELHPVTFN